MNIPQRLSRIVFGLGLFASTSCHLLPDIPDPLNLPGAKARNLEELHAPDGSYSYSAALLGDFGYLIESVTGRDRSSSQGKSVIGNPAHETMVNLMELMAVHPDTLSAGDFQVQWCARLTASDPSVLVRERAALGLGDLGVWAGLRSLRPAPPGAVYATPEQVGAALEDILRGLRVMRDGEGDDSTLKSACADAMGLYLDVDGAWRLLGVTGPLHDQAPDDSSRAEFIALAHHLRRRLVEEGLNSSLRDSSEIVRAAGLQSMVKIVGPQAMTSFLVQPMPGWSDTVVLSLVDLVARYGLPADESSTRYRGMCLSSLLSWAVDHPSPRVRARAMIALQRVVPDGPRSIREEDWHAWGLRAVAGPGSSS